MSEEENKQAEETSFYSPIEFKVYYKLVSLTDARLCSNIVTISNHHHRHHQLNLEKSHGA